MCHQHNYILQHCPSILQHCPSILQHCPSILQHCPSILQHCPSILQHCPSILQHCPSISYNSVPPILQHCPSILQHTTSYSTVPPSYNAVPPSYNILHLTALSFPSYHTVPPSYNTVPPSYSPSILQHCPSILQSLHLTDPPSYNTVPPSYSPSILQHCPSILQSLHLLLSRINISGQPTAALIRTGVDKLDYSINFDIFFETQTSQDTYFDPRWNNLEPSLYSTPTMETRHTCPASVSLHPPDGAQFHSFQNPNETVKAGQLGEYTTHTCI